jgi:opacity protein-like surface antigen
MTAGRSIVGIVALAIMCAAPTTVLAQSQGTVVRDRSVIWRADVSVIATTVPAGTILTITADQGEWYEVIIPEQFGGRGDRGRIAKALIQLLPNTPPLTNTRRDSGAARSGQRRTPYREPLLGVRGFGQVAYAAFSSRQSFDAVLGQASGFTFGGGVQIRLKSGPFVEASWDRFRKTGHSVFVFEDTVYELDTPNTITITPLTVSGGYRFGRGIGTVPYVAGGLSHYRLQETTPFTTDAEDYDKRSVGYHATVGVEFKTRSWVSTGLELRYASVRDSLGGGVMEVFNERNLGGVQAQFKVFVGR